MFFPFRLSKMQENEPPVSFLDCNKKGVKNFASDDDRLNALEEDDDGYHEGGKEKKESPWQRVKWTDKMVKLLITAVSYVGEEASSDCSGGGRRNSLLLPKKGKWKAISKVMAEKGHNLSPQQCEDKFNDLNKRYKRLNDLLGRGTSCKVVENPALLDLMDLSEKVKEDVRKILSSKQLFYQEMCSYHNKNRLYLPHDWALQQSLQFALKIKDGFETHEVRPYKPEGIDEGDKDAESDGQNNGIIENHLLHKCNGGTFTFQGVATKRKKQGEEYEVVSFGSALTVLNSNKRSDHLPSCDCTEVNQFFTESGEGRQLENQWMMTHSFQLEEQKLQLQAQRLELEKQRFKWQMFSQQEDRELDKMRLENERLKFENDCLALELKRQEIKAFVC